ncbi:MAG: hypothetical protein J0I41_15675 [Filimonas sp.]|nr:hypothetical protein [Filimonas sp.]
MKPKIFTAILLFISAYAPLFVILAIKDFDFDCSKAFNHSVPILILLGVTAISVTLLFYAIKSIKRGNMPVKVKSIKNRAIDLINYTIPYIVSFFGFDLSKTADVFSLVIFLLLMLLMTIKSKSVFMNPILLLAGYSLYDLEYEFDGKINSTIIISNHDMRNGETYYIRSLTRFLYFVTEKAL